MSEEHVSDLKRLLDHLRNKAVDPPSDEEAERIAAEELAAHREETER